jgi:hypothetical protein
MNVLFDLHTFIIYNNCVANAADVIGAAWPDLQHGSSTRHAPQASDQTETVSAGQPPHAVVLLPDVSAMGFQVPSAHPPLHDDSLAAAAEDSMQPDTSFLPEPQSAPSGNGASAADAAAEAAAAAAAAAQDGLRTDPVPPTVQGSIYGSAHQDQPPEEPAPEPLVAPTAYSTPLRVDSGAAVLTVPDLGAQAAAPSSPPAADVQTMAPSMQNSSEPNVLRVSEQPPASFVSSAPHGAEAADGSRDLPPAEFEDRSPGSSMTAEGAAAAPALTGMHTRQCTGSVLDSYTVSCYLKPLTL